MKVLLPSVAVTTLLLVSSAFAGSNKVCNEFSVISTGEFRQAQTIDVDASGADSPGDKRIGSRVLVDGDGNKVGQRFWVGIYHEFGPDGKDLRRTTEVVNVLKAGAVFSTKLRVGGKDLPSKINGGTGEFSGATGTVKVSHEGKLNIYKFRVNCPDPKGS